MPSPRPERSRPHSGTSASRGFTLVELLVVIGIIAILIGLIFPVISRAREQSKRTACMSNLRQIGQALYMYAHASRDSLPNGNPPGDWESYDGANRVMVYFAKEFVKAPGVFRCPGDSDAQPTDIVTADQTLPNSARLSYEFYSLWWPPERGPQLTKMKGRAPLAWDLDGGQVISPLQNHGRGGNVLVADGHVEWQETKLWEMPNWPSGAGKYYPTN